MASGSGTTLANPARTYCEMYMSGYRHSTASTPTGSGDPPRISQADMKAKILDEVKDAMFLVDLTAPGAPLQANPNDVQMVLNNLRFNHQTLFAVGPSTIDAPRFPPGGFDAETTSYGPLTDFLNAVIHAANRHLTGPRYLQALRFYPYGAEMTDQVNSMKPLKPDILGLLSPQSQIPNVPGTTSQFSVR